MGIVSDLDFVKELDKLNPVPSKSEPSTKDTIKEKGRGEGNVEVPNSLRKVIGETSEINGRQEAVELAGNFGISPSSVSAYANGSNSTASYDKQPNLNHLNLAKGRVSKRARSVLMKAMHHITDDKLEHADAKDLANVAKNMAGIIKDMEPDLPRVPQNIDNGPKFIIYSPQIKKEEAFDVVYTKE